jgi:hypothetical protein
VGLNFLSIIAITLSIFVMPSDLYASGGNPKFCNMKFGEGAYITFEPVESNRGMRVTDHLTGEATIEKPVDPKLPTGFRCGLDPKENAAKKCPTGMRLDKKRSGSPACLSKVFPLQELCPSEIEETWPEMKERVCKIKK